MEKIGKDHAVVEVPRRRYTRLELFRLIGELERLGASL